MELVQLKILIADDHRVLRSGLRLLLQKQPDLEVVAEASTGEQAVALTETHRPDLVILDLVMPGGAGLDVIEQLATLAKVLVLTMHDDPAYVRRVMEAGGAGYVLKEAADVELLAAIEAVKGGKTYVYPTLAAALVNSEPTLGEGRPTLSPRELEVLQLIALGHTNREISEQLAVGVRTVETYKYRVCEKLQVHTRAEMVRYALQNRLIEL